MGSTERTVVVIGAGVIGLQASISLRKAGRNVVLLAKHFPKDRSIEYTSPWAGAHWRSHAGKDDIEHRKWDTETYQHMLSVIKEEEAGPKSKPLSGLGLRHSRYFSTSNQPPWFSTLVNDYQTTPTEDLVEGLKHGHTHASVMINAPMYLEYLQNTATSLGVTAIHASLPMDGNLVESLLAARDIVQYDMGGGDDTSVDIAAFVNATGISAKSFVPDANVYPIRGHTVTVSGEAKQITTIEAPSNHASGDGTNTPIMYILPRPHSNTTILGGTKDVDNWDATPSASTTAEILRRAKEWAPELLNEEGEFNVISEQVGLRPARRGGARVEVESMDDFLVVHSYGHAGAGYQNSVGSANKVVRILEEQLGM